MSRAKASEGAPADVDGLKFHSVTFHARLEIPNMPRPNEYGLSTVQGNTIELDSMGAGIVVRHPSRERAVWIPVAAIASAEVLEDKAKGTK